MTIGIFTTPEIDKTRECEVLAKVQAPHASQLNTIVCRGAFVALEETLVEHLHGPGLREVGIMTVVSTTNQTCMLKTPYHMIQAAIILNMDSKGGIFANMVLKFS